MFKNVEEMKFYLAGEIKREGPSDGVMKRRMFSSEAIGGTEEERTELLSTIDEKRLIGVGKGGVQEAIEGKIEEN